MAYEIIDGISRADIAFRVHGNSVEEVFLFGGAALLSIMLQNPEELRTDRLIHFSCEAPDLELLYVDFLQEFIFYKDSEALLLKPQSIEIKQLTDGFILTCAASGETINRSKHQFSADIKAITMHNLSVVNDHNLWTATVVVDV